MKDASTRASDAAASPTEHHEPGRIGARIVALVIDWVLCSLIAYALLHYRWDAEGGTEGFKPMLVFAVESIALVSTLGFTIGHRIMGLQVSRLTGGPPGLVAGTVRTLLLLLVVPALITDAAGRGLHDRLAGTSIWSTR